MQVMVFDGGFPGIIGTLRGKKVLVWTCDTCARMCGVGGTGRAGEAADFLKNAGIDVVGTISQKAVCVSAGSDAEALSGTDGFDIVLMLACGVASRVAETLTGKQTVNPVTVLGPGYRDGNRRIFLVTEPDGKTVLAENVPAETPFAELFS